MATTATPKPSKTKAIASTRLAHEDISPFQESWATIPNWPAKWKASVEPTPSYFPKGSPKFVAMAHGANFGDPVYGYANTPAGALVEACKAAIATGKIVKYRGKPLSVPSKADFVNIPVKNVPIRKNPLIALPNGWQRKAGSYRSGNAAGRNKSVLYPNLTSTIFIPFSDNLDVDFDPGTGNYDSYERRNHSITLGSPRVNCDPNIHRIAPCAYRPIEELGNTSDWTANEAAQNNGAQVEVKFYSKKGRMPTVGDTIYFIKYEFDSPDYYEGDWGLVSILAAFDNKDDAMEAARYEAMGNRLRYTGYTNNGLTVEAAILT